MASPTESLGLLGKLPIEVRDHIYEIIAPSEIRCYSRCRKKPRNWQARKTAAPAIALVSRHVRNEYVKTTARCSTYVLCAEGSALPEGLTEILSALKKIPRGVQRLTLHVESKDRPKNASNPATGKDRFTRICDISKLFLKIATSLARRPAAKEVVLVWDGKVNAQLHRVLRDNMINSDLHKMAVVFPHSRHIHYRWDGKIMNNRECEEGEWLGLVIQRWMHDMGIEWSGGLRYKVALHRF